MIRVRRRGATGSILPWFAGALVVIGTLVPCGSAQAESITQTKEEIAALSAALSHEEAVSETTANQYDADKVRLASIDADIVTLDAKVAQKRVAVAATSHRLEIAVVRAYVLGVADAQIMALFDQNVATSDARRVYEDLVIGNLTSIRNAYESQKLSLDRSLAQVAAARVTAERQTSQMQSLLAANVRLVDQTRATLTAVTARLKNEIISYEIAVGAADARERNIAGEEEAVAAATAVGGSAAGNLVLEAIAKATPPVIKEIAGTATGDAAVKYAESQTGVPYVWGGETPGVGFDCSGLVQWAWGRAGVEIPRTTEEQYPDLPHVSLNDLQPGDLLYYYNLDGDNEVDHVVMYVGSGPYGTSTVIAAAHTGTLVGYEPLFTFGLIGAARP